MSSAYMRIGSWLTDLAEQRATWEKFRNVLIKMNLLAPVARSILLE